MYIEDKSGGIIGPARIGRVSFSKSGRSLYYAGRKFRPIQGYKANHIDVESGDEFWISGCRRDGNDALYGAIVEIDEEVREEYWEQIRNQPGNKHLSSFRSPGKH
jgi:hypothetical protein